MFRTESGESGGIEELCRETGVRASLRVAAGDVRLETEWSSFSSLVHSAGRLEVMILAGAPRNGVLKNKFRENTEKIIELMR